jgi:signal transduction histidine kinase
VVGGARGWLRDTRLDLPLGGGEFVLPSGEPAVAEPVGDEEGFIVRGLGGPTVRSPREALVMLADEQAALRRLATTAARSASPREIFTAVAEAVAGLLGADDAAVARFDSDHSATLVAGVGQWVRELGVGISLKLDDSLALTAVHRTGRFARVDPRDYVASGPVPDYFRRAGHRSTVGNPIVVEGRLWGGVIAATKRDPLPADTEERLANFTELVGTVIANAEHRTELTASRARVVAAGDEARRRIRRDLHDGAQQRLVSTVVTLKLARQELGNASGPAVDLLDEALAHAEGANAELRELAHGILPTALNREGLRGAIDALVSRVRLPVSVDVTPERLPPTVEANAYFIVAEALTNTVRHANATSAHIAAVVHSGALWLEVCDDGVGGALSDGSSGLLGLRDRAAALDGELRVESPPGEGTLVAATLPIQEPDSGQRGSV